ncbi:Zn-dependent protease with chaperone function [Granulicella aggregans]|uniref:Zn-dependent protease with chaperone function n=1 Tax=Granulicella aggregans TaxID=474949 RepID=A0A7W7ZCI2_9BACT|nr:M48 family metallopeptidase [Granulicella aggregans]MBB5057323.1 Zn-dependent protease with chaperone function [Granulicella aggregans]
MNFRWFLMMLVCVGFLLAVPRVEAEATATHALQGDAAYRLPPAKLKVAIELNGKRTAIEFLYTGWTIVQLVLLLRLGAAAWMRRVAVGFSQNRWVQGFAFYFLFLAITSLLSLPLEIYGHHVSLVYGQSVQQWGSWFADKGKSFLLAYLIGGLLVMLLFFCIRRSAQRWWFWFWIPTMAAVVFGVFVSPILIDPIFNKFEPLQASNPALVARLEQVVARGGIVIPPERMFLMRASEKVTGLNAYVTGIGASKRVVVWDTSIAKATPDEISYIFGHEMGHYVLNHIYKGIAAAAVGLLVMFFVGYHCVQWLIARYGARGGVDGQGDWAAFVVVMLVFSVLSFLGEPVGNAVSRMQEHEADVYGQEAIHGIVVDPQAVAQRSFQVLGEESLVDPTPHPLVEFWTFSHPPIAERARFAAAYDPWALGNKPKYFGR